MEELQSTENLEREILEDARKKASRILKTADDTISEKNKEWEKKTADSINAIETGYNEQKKIIHEKTMSRLPIDRLRAKTDKIENILQEAIDDWYKNTSKDQINGLLSQELNKRLDFCKGIRSSQKIKAYFGSMDRKDVDIILKNADINISNMEEIKSANPYPALTIETDNTRIIVSIQNIIDFYLETKREELVGALVGRDFMESI